MADDEKPDEQNQADRQGLVTGRHVGIQPVEIRDEIQNAYLDYAMSVIVGRALPDVRDDLRKDSHRLDGREGVMARDVPPFPACGTPI